MKLNMNRELIIIIIPLFWITGVSLNKNKDVHQTPADLLGKLNGEVNLTCKHSISSYNTILWYQRSEGDSSLKLIGYTSYTITQVVEEPYQSHFNVSGNDPDSTAETPAGSSHSAAQTDNMIPPRLIIFIITLFWIEGVSLSKEKQVLQTPPELLRKLNDEVKLTFTHNITSYDTILWYQRSAGDSSLKLIAYMYFKSPTVESPFKSHFNVSGDGEKKAFLHILKQTS
ncbi:uncharacterized protein LOC144542544 [Centroberyx gerrardi]